MISRSEIVRHGMELSEAQEVNVRKLLIRMNKIRAEYGLPMIVTSGVRSEEDEKRIDPAHPNSLHTKGAAVDIYDPDPERRLWNWCVDHLDLLAEIGVWMESRVYSTNHVHFQIWPPESGNRIFIP